MFYLHNPLTKADLQAVAELVSEADRYPWIVRVEVRDIKAGYSRHNTQTIVVPKWALLRSDDYAIYYTIHELAHIIVGVHGHGVKYKRTEDRLLKHWELAIDRKRVYPRTLYSRGQIVYSRRKN